MKQLTFQAVKSSAQQSKRLMQVLLPVITLVPSPKLDTLSEKTADVKSAGHDVHVLVGDVVLHACLFIDGQLNSLIDGATQTTVVLTSILVVSVVLGVVNMVYEGC